MTRSPRHRLARRALVLSRGCAAAWRQTRSPGRRLTLAGLAALGLTAVLFVGWPLPPRLLDADGAWSVRVLDRDGQLLRELPSRRASRSVSLPAEAPVPPVLRDAFIASEDRRFEWHPGIDPVAM